MAIQTTSNELIDLEKRFWQSLVEEDTDSALAMLDEPSVIVGPHGAMRIDHATYRKMAEEGPMVVTSFELNDVDVVFPTADTAVVTYRVNQSVAPREKAEDIRQEEMADSSVWTRKGGSWRCVMHTETPVTEKKK
jgi:hypothetical protein